MKKTSMDWFMAHCCIMYINIIEIQFSVFSRQVLLYYIVSIAVSDLPPLWLYCRHPRKKLIGCLKLEDLSHQSKLGSFFTSLLYIPHVKPCLCSVRMNYSVGVSCHN